MSSVQEERTAFVPITSADELDKAPQSTAGEAAGIDQGESGNIDKIREIIFGGHMRDYDKRFMRLEARLIKEGADLRDDTKRRFEVLEMFIKREFEAPPARFRSGSRSPQVKLPRQEKSRLSE